MSKCSECGRTKGHSIMCAAGRRDAEVHQLGKVVSSDLQTPKLPRVVYPGGLTGREHAIIAAHRWQVANRPQGYAPEPGSAYGIIVDLLALLPFDEVRAAIAKADGDPR